MLEDFCINTLKKLIVIEIICHEDRAIWSNNLDQTSQVNQLSPFAS